MLCIPIPQAQLCIKVLINCASDSFNLPAFNSSYSHSDVIILTLPLTHGQFPSLAFNCKMLLALLDPLLDCDQLRALKLTKNEANMCVSLLSKAVSDPTHQEQELTLLTYLRVMVSFSQEYHRRDQELLRKGCSKYEKKLLSVSNELKANIQMLVEGGVLSVLKDLLKAGTQDEVRMTAIKCLWCLAHNPTIKMKILENVDVVKALQCVPVNLSAQLNLTSYLVLSLVDQPTSGKFIISAYKILT